MQTSQTAAVSNTVAVRLRVNGQNYSLRLDPRTSLLDLLRERLDRPGTKKGCNSYHVTESSRGAMKNKPLRDRWAEQLRLPKVFSIYGWHEHEQARRKIIRYAVS